MVRGDEQSQPARTAAVVDIGSNSVRLVIASVQPDGRIEVLERAARPVRLGHDTFVRGRLQQPSVNAVISVLRDYRRLMDTYGVEIVRAVATSAVREAGNRDSFLDRIAMSVDIDVSVIDPMEESRLIVSALREEVGNRLALKRRVALVAEVGGGSTLLTVLRRGEIAGSQSYDLGSVRMQEMLGTANEPPDRAADLLRQHVASTIELARKSMGLRRLKMLLAIGGDARFAGRQVGTPVDGSDLRVVGSADLHGLMRECESRTPEQLVRRYGLAFADAETLVPALLVYNALLTALGGQEFIVCQVSMREGLLLDLPRYISGEEDQELVEGILHSAESVGARYQYDVEHARHVAALSVRLFDEMQGEHRLGRHHRLLLQVAAVLHDMGLFVGARAHHKHSHYIIANSEIYGLQREDVNLVAVIARYHRRSMPKASHLEYTGLARDQRIVVSKLAAILRVADALDRGHWQQVTSFDLERRERELVIYVRGVPDLTLERRALAVKGDMFEEVFGLKVRLEEASGP